MPMGPQDRWKLFKVETTEQSLAEREARYFDRLREHLFLSNGRALLAQCHTNLSSLGDDDRQRVMEGVSRTLHVGDPRNTENLVEDIMSRSSTTSAIAEDTVILAISYKYEQRGGLSRAKWQRLIEEVEEFVARQGLVKYAIWCDQLLDTRDGRGWHKSGFLPYLVFPVFSFSNSVGGTDRCWIELEKLAGRLSAGLYTKTSTVEDSARVLAVTSSIWHSAEMLAAVLERNVADAYQTYHRWAADGMKRWAANVINSEEVEFSMTQSADVVPVYKDYHLQSC